MPKQAKKRRSKTVSARLFRSSANTSTISRVVERFKELLRDGQLKPGDRLPNETELAKSFGASRGSIREAVKMLVSFGILQVKWGAGTYVCTSISEGVVDHSLFQLLISSDDNRHLMELRQIMEVGLAQLAIDHAQAEDLEEITRRHEEMEQIILGGETDPEKLAEADASFHLAISKSTHNPLIDRIYKFAMEMYYPSIVVTHGNRNGVEEMMQSPIVHRNILGAIRARDKKAVAKAVCDSLETWFEHL